MNTRFGMNYKENFINKVLVHDFFYIKYIYINVNRINNKKSNNLIANNNRLMKL